MSGLRVARLPEGDLQRHKENTKSSANYGVELSRCKAILLTTVVKKKEKKKKQFPQVLSQYPLGVWLLCHKLQHLHSF